MNFNLYWFIVDFRDWSRKTFGAGNRTAGLLKHIVEEVEEIRESPKDLTEWVDVIFLALDGACRIAEPAEIIEAIQKKHAKNKSRRWPDPATLAADMPAKHVKHVDTL